MKDILNKYSLHLIQVWTNGGWLTMDFSWDAVVGKDRAKLLFNRAKEHGVSEVRVVKATVEEMENLLFLTEED